MRDDPLLALVAVFVPFSFISIGGGPSIFAGIQHQSVEVQHWLSPREFIDLFAIARAAPGPGSMLTTLIGFKVAGLPGAIVATLALFAPSSILCFVVARIWNRYRGTDWHAAIERGLAPVGAGLILAGMLSIFRIAGSGPLAWGVTGASAALLAYRPRLHPLLVMAAGAVVFVAANAV